MSDVTDIKAEVLLLRRENKELRDENKQLKFRDATLSLMVKLMHLYGIEETIRNEDQKTEVWVDGD
jgi:hypothetical protein